MDKGAGAQKRERQRRQGAGAQKRERQQGQWCGGVKRERSNGDKARERKRESANGDKGAGRKRESTNGDKGAGAQKEKKARGRTRESANGDKVAGAQKRERQRGQRRGCAKKREQGSADPHPTIRVSGNVEPQSFSSSPEGQTPPAGYVDMIDLNITQLYPDQIRSGCLETGRRVADGGPAAAAPPRNARKASVAHFLNIT